MVTPPASAARVREEREGKGRGEKEEKKKSRREGRREEFVFIECVAEQLVESFRWVLGK
jgi:hypothetical protein